MFAVIKTGGKQYKVSAGEILKLEKLEGKEGDTLEFSEILMVGQGEEVKVGSPNVDGARVTSKILEQTRAGKVIAFKKRRRKNSQRTRGHRQHLTIVRINEILV